MTKNQNQNQLLLLYKLGKEASPKHRQRRRVYFNPLDKEPPAPSERAGLRTLGNIASGAGAGSVSPAEALAVLNLLERQGRALLAYESHYPMPLRQD